MHAVRIACATIIHGGSGGRRVIGGAKINNQYCLSIFFPAFSDIATKPRALFPLQCVPRPFFHAVRRRPRSLAPSQPSPCVLRLRTLRRYDRAATRRSWILATAAAAAAFGSPQTTNRPNNAQVKLLRVGKKHNIYRKKSPGVNHKKCLLVNRLLFVIPIYCIYVVFHGILIYVTRR